MVKRRTVMLGLLGAFAVGITTYFFMNERRKRNEKFSRTERKKLKRGKPKEFSRREETKEEIKEEVKEMPKVKLDDTIHSKDKLLQVFKANELNYATILVNWYSIVVVMQKSNMFSVDQMRTNVMTKIGQAKNEID